jgi:hypothetical protein
MLSHISIFRGYGPTRKSLRLANFGQAALTWIGLHAYSHRSYAL